MKHIHVNEKLSNQCKKDIKFSLKYLKSKECQNYKIYRDYGGPFSCKLPKLKTMKLIKKSARGGAKILRKHGSEILRQMRERQDISN